jgi:hypothetical protein
MTLVGESRRVPGGAVPLRASSPLLRPAQRGSRRSGSNHLPRAPTGVSARAVFTGPSGAASCHWTWAPRSRPAGRSSSSPAGVSRQPGPCARQDQGASRSYPTEASWVGGLVSRCAFRRADGSQPRSVNAEASGHGVPHARADAGVALPRLRRTQRPRRQPGLNCAMQSRGIGCREGDPNTSCGRSEAEGWRRSHRQPGRAGVLWLSEDKSLPAGRYLLKDSTAPVTRCSDHD